MEEKTRLRDLLSNPAELSFSTRRTLSQYASVKHDATVRTVARDKYIYNFHS